MDFLKYIDKPELINQNVVRHFGRPEIKNHRIYQLILRSTDGKSIILYYLKKERLKKNLRNLLSRIVVGDEKDRQFERVHRDPEIQETFSFSIKGETFAQWSEEIALIFPSESKFIYYSPYDSACVRIVNPDGTITNRRRKRNRKGTLVEHFEYLKDKLRTQGLLTATQRESVPEVLAATDEEQAAAEWLATNIGPPDSVKEHWIKSYPVRKTRLNQNCTVHDYFAELPALKGGQGPELVALDFQRLYPDREDSLFERWDVARTVIINSLEDCRALNGDDLGFFKALPSLAQHNKDAVLLYLLPYIIKPSRKHIGAEKLLSIREKQESFFIHVQTAADIDAALDNQRQICNNSNTTLQPIPIFVGPLVNLKSFYIYINDCIKNPTIYQCQTVLHTIDLTVRIFYALYCEFPARVYSIWTFIKKALYNINSPIDNCSRETVAIIGQISQQILNENRNPNIV
ncbi:uncharacterized protein [Chelonus insularis]|uniref:uncharacterized protein n=1 Tax=Chelonus insularis TaxID=460826 RepID=UPI00158F6786|nr:uncharacterized protein LOC118065423 [Chelonus insularis]XP_034936583.1 uncharacterized protein LOC118065423 [Chelonus insularis]XP_034950684.1 uncharacterized protein LOC118073972 [Chelonus insularis]XP_034950685.1 uncharacterized protein LOC118073972 [Chelonus insularis]XP_034952435.1 uncharacterized protein LOC118074974 [Chelonus insularis]XP_034952436.1 uncharacterized protein LOC118074974 [Chelonus insularis]